MPSIKDIPPSTRSVKSWVRENLYQAAQKITTAQDLVDYAREFPSPLAGALLLADIKFFTEPKVVGGKRDGKKIYEHIKLGFGPRLTADWDLTQPERRDWDANLVIGLSLWLDKNWLKKDQTLSSRMAYRDRINHKKDFGVEDPAELIYEFLYILGYVLLSKIPPRIMR